MAKMFIVYSDRCPQCSSANLDRKELRFAFEWTEAFQECTCNDCGFTWADIYTYAYSQSNTLPEKRDDLIDRIIEVSRWSSIITTVVTQDNCRILESSSKGGVTTWVAFSANGSGYSIDFENHIVSRNTAYDEETR